jgi:hypothetical protein
MRCPYFLVVSVEDTTPAPVRNRGIVGGAWALLRSSRIRRVAHDVRAVIDATPAAAVSPHPGVNGLDACAR